jgi:kumamolisin
MEGAKLIGPADPNEKMEVTVYLRRGSKPEAYPNIAQLGSLPVKERHHLSREEFANAHGSGCR